MILVQHFSGTRLADITDQITLEVDDVITIGRMRYLVHWVKHTRAGIEVGVEDITPSGGCGG